MIEVKLDLIQGLKEWITFTKLYPAFFKGTIKRSNLLINRKAHKKPWTLFMSIYKSTT